MRKGEIARSGEGKENEETGGKKERKRIRMDMNCLYTLLQIKKTSKSCILHCFDVAFHTNA